MHRLTLDLPDDVFQPLAQAASQAAQTLEEWVTAQLVRWIPKRAMSSEGRAEGMKQLMRHAGAVDLGHPTGADNVRIDEDLALQYGSTHENQG